MGCVQFTEKKQCYASPPPPPPPLSSHHYSARIICGRRRRLRRPAGAPTICRRAKPRTDANIANNLNQLHLISSKLMTVPSSARARTRASVAISIK